MNILIITPDLNKLNGVAIHYKGLYNYWKSNVTYFTKAPNKNIFRQFISCIKFIYALYRNSVELIVLNVSLKKGFYSQFQYLIISKLLKKKLVLFIHGWDINSEYMLCSTLSKYIFKNINAVIVLAQVFKKKIDALYDIPIYLTSTKVADSMINKFDISSRKGQITRFLFVSRVEKEKGIFLALEIFKIINKKYPNTTFHIVGEGNASAKIQNIISSEKINNVTIKGRLEGHALYAEYANADFFFLLSMSEGIPAALLEAMAFGLPIATRPVGGIPDFFIDKQMGILSESLNPYYYYERISKLIESPDEVKEISRSNYLFAKQHFMASQVAQQMESIFQEIINKK